MPVSRKNTKKGHKHTAQFYVNRKKRRKNEKKHERSNGDKEFDIWMEKMRKELGL